jgi:peptidoglycan/LPS O-acetylase OafA/YrhL
VYGERIVASVDTTRHWRALDGLRGVAILLVMGEHFQLPGFTNGGQVGVTLFFVLSGFLITSLLLRDRRDYGGIRFGHFYRRRALRLLPALLAMLAVIVPLMAVTGHDWVAATLPALLYYSNWAQAASGQIPVIGHTWTLSIEEQFYIVWPVVLMLVPTRLRGITWPVLILASGAVASVVVRALLWHPDAAGYFRTIYGSDTRADALLLGCALAFLTTRSTVMPPRWLIYAAIAIGVTTIVTPSLGFLAVVGLAAAALAAVVLVAAATTDMRSLLNVEPLVWVGTASYSLYLWHVPILSLIRESFLGYSSVGWILALALTLIAAGLSRRYVELPFLRWRAPTPVVKEPAAGLGG